MNDLNLPANKSVVSEYMHNCDVSLSLLAANNNIKVYIQLRVILYTSLGNCARVSVLDESLVLILYAFSFGATLWSQFYQIV